MKNKEKEQYEKELFSLIKKQIENYSTDDRENYLKICADNNVREDISNIINNSKTLTKKQILEYEQQYERNPFICPLLFECKNVPSEMVKKYISFTMKSPIQKVFANEILSINLPRNVINDCLNELVEMYNEYIVGKNIKHDYINGKTALEIAKKLFYNANSYIEDDLFGAIKLDHSLSKEEFDHEFQKMATYKFRKDVAKSAIEKRKNALLKNPNINPQIINIIYENGEMNNNKIPEQTPSELISYIYESVIDALYYKENQTTNSDTVIALNELFRNKHLDAAMQYDLFKALQYEVNHKTIPSEFVQKIITSYMWKNKSEFNPEALRCIMECCNEKNTIDILFSENVPHKIKQELAQNFLEKIKDQPLRKSRTHLLNALIMIARIIPLTDKKYEEILSANFESQKLKDLYKTISTSPTTPEKYLNEIEKTKPNDVYIKITQYAKQNGLTAEDVDLLYQTIERDYVGTNRKASINIDCLDAVLKNKKIDLGDFLYYIKNVCKSNSELMRSYYTNICRMEYIYEEYKQYGFSKGEYLKRCYPTQYFLEKKEEILDKIMYNEQFVVYPSHMILKNILNNLDYYCEIRKFTNKKPLEIAFEEKNNDITK